MYIFLGITILFSSIINGWVLSVLWNWFMTYSFGLPELSIPEAMGLALIVSFLTNRYVPNNEQNQDENALIAALISAFVGPLFALLVGWLIYLFV